MVRVAGRRLSSLSRRSAQSSPAVAYVSRNPINDVDSCDNSTRSSSSPHYISHASTFLHHITGNKKLGTSAGRLATKGGKVSRYSAEAAAEDIGRKVRELRLKSVVMKVNGFTSFKEKKQSVLSFREGCTHSRGDVHPVVYIEDTTRKPRNGCRLRKKRRV